jgi:ABC-type transport system involved in cytochrome bd biosynthesis fused ATPase/permease subunit
VRKGEYQPAKPEAVAQEIYRVGPQHSHMIPMIIGPTVDCGRRTIMASQSEYAIQASNLSYRHAQDTKASLSDLNFALPHGSRTILIGANGGTGSLLCPIHEKKAKEL